MKLSLLIPVYNEASHLMEFLDKLDGFDFAPFEVELIFVDDCSKDGSADLIKNYKFRNANRFFAQEKNQGKGAAIARAITEATGDLLAVQDADFEYDLRDLRTLLDPFLVDRADVVFGSRFRKDGNQVHRTFHYLINRFLTLLSNLLSGLYLSDMETCYKVFRADILQNIHLESKRFGFEPEVTAKIARLKIRVIEIPISYYPRNYLEGKKINWKDGVAAVWHILRFNLSKSILKRAFKSEMPKRFMISGRQWL